MVGFVSWKIFRQTSPAYSRQLYFGCVAISAESLLYVVDLLVLSSVISPWRSYSAGLPLPLSMGVRFCKDGFYSSSTKLASGGPTCVAL